MTFMTERRCARPSAFKFSNRLSHQELYKPFRIRMCRLFERANTSGQKQYATLEMGIPNTRFSVIRLIFHTFSKIGDVWRKGWPVQK